DRARLVGRAPAQPAKLEGDHSGRRIRPLLAKAELAAEERERAAGFLGRTLPRPGQRGRSPPVLPARRRCGLCPGAIRLAATYDPGKLARLQRRASCRMAPEPEHGMSAPVNWAPEAEQRLASWVAAKRARWSGDCGAPWAGCIAPSGRRGRPAGASV